MPRVRFLALVTFAVAACGRTSGEAEHAAESPTAVAVSRAARADLQREVVLTGPVEPIRVVGVNSRTAGTILSIRVVEGDRVRSGQLMAELDARETAAQLDRVRAVLANAETAFRRAEEMRASQILTDAEFEQARAAFVMAQSDVELWAARLEFSRVLAPTAGTVTAKHIEAGTAVSVNQRLFDIADDSLLVVRVQMSELDVVRVAPGDSVAVQLDALEGVSLPARVRRVFPSADPATRLVPVEVALGRTARRAAVRPGFLARARFAVDRRADAIVVPASAVGTSATGSYVFMVDADTLVRRAVTTGMTSGDLVEISRGLAGGERIVTSGHLNLRPGARVRVTRDDVAPVDTLALRAGAAP